MENDCGKIMKFSFPKKSEIKQYRCKQTKYEYKIYFFENFRKFANNLAYHHKNRAKTRRHI